MALYQTDAVVLKSAEFGEAHRLLTLLTPGQGLVRAVAKGARRPVSRLGGALVPFTHCHLLLWRGRSLDGISQAEVVEPFRRLREDLEAMAAAIYLCEVAGEMVPEGQETVRTTEMAASFRLLLASFHLLATGRRPDLALRYAELQFLRLGGFGPGLADCHRCGGPLPAGPVYFSPAAGGCLCRPCARGEGTAPVAAGGMWLEGAALQGARRLWSSPPVAVPDLPIPPETSAQLGNALELYLDRVLERRLRSRAFFEIANGVHASGAPGTY